MVLGAVSLIPPISLFSGPESFCKVELSTPERLIHVPYDLDLEVWLANPSSENPHFPKFVDQMSSIRVRVPVH